MKVLFSIFFFPFLFFFGNNDSAPDNSAVGNLTAILYDNVTIRLCEDECTQFGASTNDIIIQFIDGVPPYRATVTNSWATGFPITIRDAGEFHHIRVCHDNNPIVPTPTPTVEVTKVADTTFLKVPSSFFPGELLVTAVEDANNCQGTIESLNTLVGPIQPVPFDNCGISLGTDYTADVPRNSCDTLLLPPIEPPMPTAKYYTEPGGMGTEYCPGDEICYFQTQLPGGGVVETLYIYDGMGSPEVAIPFTINRSPFIQISEDTISCGSYRLEDFSGPLVTPRAQYANDPSFTSGSLLNQGDEITADTWIYVADTTENTMTGGQCTFLDSFYVDFVQALNPGLDTVLTICAGSSTIIPDPFELLRGAEAGGQWSGTIIPDLDFNNPIDVDLSPMSAGNSWVLIYTIENSGCPADTWSSSITFNAVAPPYAGQDSTLILCASGDMDFLEYLRFPDTNGQLVQISGEPVVVSDPSSVNMSSVNPGQFEFEYTIAATASCPAQTARLLITLTTGVNAGADNTGFYCHKDQVSLSTLLSADADTGGEFISGGFFSIPNGEWDTGSLFLPIGFGSEEVEVLYVLDGSVLNCDPDTAVFSITLIEDPEAGIPMNNPIDLCAGDQIGLPQLLTGESDYGQFFLTSDYTTALDTLWTIPDTDEQVAYVVPGVGSCEPDTSYLNIIAITPATVSFDLSDDALCSSDGCVTGTFMTSRAVAVDMRITDDLGNLLDFRKDQFDNDTYVICPGGNFADTNLDTIFLGAGASFTFEIRGVEDIQTGCSSAAILTNLSELTIGQSYEETFLGTVCEGNTTEINGVEYGASTVLPLTTVTGCDSIINIVIDTIALDTGMIQRIFCESSGPQEILGQTFSTDTSELISFNSMGAGGCDSIAQVDIVFTNVATGILDTFACPGGSVEIDGVVIAAEGSMEIDFAGGSAANCDSTTRVNFVFASSAVGTLDTIICMDESFVKGLDTYGASMTTGSSILIGADAFGCDSVLTVNVSFYPAIAATLDTMICAGESFSKGMDTYDQNNLSGTSVLVGASTGGCDSLLAVTVSLSDQIEIMINETICQGQTIDIYGTTYGQGLLTGMEMIPAVGGGCDTIATITVTEIIPATESVNDMICADGTRIINGTTYDADRLTGQEIILSAEGCDSLVIDIALSVSATDAVIENELLCEGEATGTFDLISVSGLSLPLEVYLDGTLVQTVTSLPVTVAAEPGTSMITLDDGTCSYDTTVALQAFNTSSASIIVTDLGMNTYTLSYQSDFTPNLVSWNPTGILDCGDCEVVNAMILQDTEVSLLLTTPEGCEVLVFTTLTYESIEPDSTRIIYQSDIFQPLDSENGTFYVQSNLETTIDKLSIYDRWGNLVFLNENFLSNDPLEGWNGFYENVLARQGVYVYHIQYRDEDGRMESLSNQLTLLR